MLGASWCAVPKPPLPLGLADFGLLSSSVKTTTEDVRPKRLRMLNLKSLGPPYLANDFRWLPPMPNFPQGVKNIEVGGSKTTKRDFIFNITQYLFSYKQNTRETRALANRPEFQVFGDPRRRRWSIPIPNKIPGWAVRLDGVQREAAACKADASRSGHAPHEQGMRRRAPDLRGRRGRGSPQLQGVDAPVHAQQ